MTGFHLVVQGAEVATPDLKALARARPRQPRSSASTGEAFRIARADPSTREAVARALRRRLARLGLRARTGAGSRTSACSRIDMDSTLITIECIDEIADFAGRKAEVAAVTAAAMRGEIDWPQSLRQPRGGARRAGRVGRSSASTASGCASRRAPSRCSPPRGAPASRRCSSRAASPTSPTACASGSGFTEAHANELVVEDGRLAGRVDRPARGRGRQGARTWRACARRWRSPRERVLAIGDGANDLEMMAEAGTSIAFHAKPRGARAARPTRSRTWGWRACSPSSRPRRRAPRGPAGAGSRRRRPARPARPRVRPAPPRSCGRSHQVARLRLRSSRSSGCLSRRSFRNRVASDS